MSWFFLRMENGIISLVLCGFYHNQDGVFWEISQKLCFWGFLLFLQKWPSYIKNRLGPLFFTTKPTYSLNLVKNGKVVWSESFVEVAALDRKQKWTITLQWRLIRLQRDSPSLCIISLRSVQIYEFLLSAARCPSGNWNTFATEKITLQTNCETDFSKINVLEVYFCRREESLYRCHSLKCYWWKKWC